MTCRLSRTFALFLLLALTALSATARSFFISPWGDDAGLGTLKSPYLTLNRAQEFVQPGDTVWMRGGHYYINSSQIMGFAGNYARVFDFKKSGEKGRPICYFAWPEDTDRPIFDFSSIRPDSCRVSAFYMRGNWLHLKGFDIIGVLVNMKGHTQSECITVRDASHCIFEELRMHDGMAIGYYQTGGRNNLVLNCDAYNNYDYYSEGEKGGNTDGFGIHLNNENLTGNRLVGCRAFWNSDDGFDCINNKAPVEIINCWAFLNGWKPGTLLSAGDGTGFKMGGYGMGPADKTRAPQGTAPRNVLRNCIAYLNKNNGIYANHHLGGIDVVQCTSYRNPKNYNMVCRISTEINRDTLGYDHHIEGNLSWHPTRKDQHCTMVDTLRSTLLNNTFFPGRKSDSWDLTEADFESIDDKDLMLPRQANGALPHIQFLRVSPLSPLYEYRIGYQF